MRFLPLLAAASLALARGAAAQAPQPLGTDAERALTQYTFDRWDDRQGLPQNSVQAMAQTSDGYLWLGTQAGLVRFDGVRFTSWGRGSDPALMRPYIWALEADRDGGLWIGTEETGLVHMLGGRFTAYGRAQGLPHPWVSAIHRDAGGTLWVGTRGGGLATMQGRRLVPVDTAVVPGRHVFAIAETGDGGVWVATGRGVTRVRGGARRTFDAHAGLPAPLATALLPARGGGLWVGTPNGVALIRGDSVVATYGAAEGVPAGWVADLREDAHGSLWIATPTAVVRLRAGRVAAVPRDRLPDGAAETLFTDHEGSLWVGTAGGGLARLRETPIVPFGAQEGLSSDFVFPLLQDRRGDVWVGTADAGVNRIRDGKVTTYRSADGALLSDGILSLAEDRDGAVWVGTGKGLTRIDARGSTHFTSDDGAPKGGGVRAMVADAAGTLWLGTATGLHRFRPGAPRSYGTAQGLADPFVTTLMAEADGGVWIGTRTGVSRLREGRMTTYTRRHGLPDGPVKALHRGRDGTLWIATGAGLARLRDGRVTVVSAAQGLCDDELHWILEDARGALWISANRGILRVDPREAAEVAEGRRPRISCTLYGRAEGMRSREANGAANPAGWRGADGRLWFPTIAGVVTLDPERVAFGVAPPRVRVEEARAGGRVLDLAGASLEPGARDLEVQYTALSFTAPEKMRFRYRLRGLDDAWVDAGNRRTAYFTNLPPGRYTFEVMAANADGEWSRAGASLPLDVRAHPWELRPFRALLLAAVLGVALLLYRRRVRALKARALSLQALVEERSRAEARYRELFDNATDAVFTADAAGRITAINRRAEELTGYSQFEARRLAVRDLLPAGDAGEGVAAQWMRGAVEPPRLLDVRTKSGEIIPLEISTRLIVEDGRPVGTQAVGRDIRDRAELERQLRQAQKMEAVGQLAGGVAHDFNNLLTIIKGGSELLLADLPARDPSREDVEQILAAADRAAGLTRQLLAFSRKEVVQPREVDLNAVVGELDPMLRRLIGEDIRVTTAVGGRPVRVLADPGQLEQVLVNLAVNARDAMPGGGRRTIQAGVAEAGDDLPAALRGAGDRCAVLVVSDTGAGMDESVQARIFEPFFTTKDPGKGTGLGLSTVYGIVHQAGGAIRCTSAAGRGTTFRIYLPLCASCAEAPAAAETAVARGGTETVLLVEDEASVRAVASRILARHGYRVLEVSRGPDALRVAQAHAGRIHLLLTDLVMPEMSGQELARQLTARRPDTRVLFTSGYTDDEILRRGVAQPGTAFVQKPFSVETLVRAVREVLDAEPERAVAAGRPRAG